MLRQQSIKKMYGTKKGVATRRGNALCSVCAIDGKSVGEKGLKWKSEARLLPITFLQQTRRVQQIRTQYAYWLVDFER